jgi:hypothetical protein
MKAIGVAVIGIAAADHLDPLVSMSLGLAHLDRQAEPVQKLRAQFALFGVAGAHQHEARGMADRQPLALDDVLARLRHVEQQIDEVILQQVDLVDIEIAAIGPRQQARLERLFALGQGAFDIQRADDAVLGRAERQVDHRGRFLDHGIGPRPAQSGHVSLGCGVHGAARHGLIGGSSAASPRTAVDLPVPRSPKTRTPPMPGSMAVRIMACFISSWPTMAEKGKGAGHSAFGLPSSLSGGAAGPGCRPPRCLQWHRRGTGRKALRETSRPRARHGWRGMGPIGAGELRHGGVSGQIEKVTCRNSGTSPMPILNSTLGSAPMACVIDGSCPRTAMRGQAGYWPGSSPRSGRRAWRRHAGTKGAIPPIAPRAGTGCQEDRQPSSARAE